MGRRSIRVMLGVAAPVVMLGVAAPVTVPGLAPAAGAAAGVQLLRPGERLRRPRALLRGHPGRRASPGLQLPEGVSDRRRLPAGTRCGGSGKGGGGGSTTYSAWVGVKWDFTGAVRSTTVLTGAPTTLDPTLTAFDAHGDEVYNSLSAINVLPPNCTYTDTTYCYYSAWLTVPVPAAPTAVSASQTGDSLSGGLDRIQRPHLGLHGHGDADRRRRDAHRHRQGQRHVGHRQRGGTIHRVLGDGHRYRHRRHQPPSTPVVITTQAATVAPSAPTGLKVSWKLNGQQLGASWTAAVAGNSPIDDYQVQVAQSTPPASRRTSTPAQRPPSRSPGSNNALDWAVQVRAHNAAGCGRWSTKVVLPAF